MLRPRIGDGADDLSLLRAHEAMVITGSYRQCLEPLKTLLERTQPGSEASSYVLARAGIAALEHRIPLDMGPVVNGLGLLSGRVRGRDRNRPEDPVLALLKELLRALLLEDRSSWVESEEYAQGLITGSDRSFSQALLKAAEIGRSDKDQGAYHELKCLLMMGRTLASSGDFFGGTERLRKVGLKAAHLGFPAMEMSARQDLGGLSEDLKEATNELARAMDLAREIGNEVEGARSRIILHQIASRESDASPEGRNVIEGSATGMLSASDSIGREDPLYAMDARSNAALWLARIGKEDGSVAVLRGVMKELLSYPDKDLEMKVLAVGVLAHMRRGDRKKAKRGLLSLIRKKPVKNHPEAFSILKEAVSGQDWLREDKETAELFAAEPEYLLERSAANEIIARAKEAYPNEFGAMLRGINRITHIEPVMESAEGKAAYMFSMFNRFSQRMVEGEGVVHSHPSGAAYPSGADIAMFHQFPGINIIIGYPYTDDSMAAYDRLGNRVTLRIVPDGG